MPLKLPETVRMIEVGPRDGLQNEPKAIPLASKLALIDALGQAGCPEIEVAAFVSPHRVPQMADAEVVVASLKRRAGITYSALVPNEKGLERILAGSLDRISVFTAASETFNQRNIHASVAESIERFRPVVRKALASNLGVRGYVSTALVCPYEGPVSAQRVVDVVRRLLDLGVQEVSLGDTIGAAVPSQVERLLDELEGTLSLEQTALHLHDTWGTALANAMTGLRRGVRIFDTSIGGLGGCPFAPGASGNLATEDLHYLLDQMGIQTGLDPEGLRKASDLIEEALGRPLPSRVRKARGASLRVS